MPSASSNKQFDNLDNLLNQQVQQSNSPIPAEFEFGSMAQWPDEDKPQIEASYRRRRPIEGTWVLLGNDELWLIPEIQYLGKDIEVVEKRSLFKRVFSFNAVYKKYRLLHELMIKVMEGAGNDGINARWDDAYMLMFLAVTVNYKIPATEINRLGLIRQEHIKDILAALSGVCKKKVTPVESDLPLPLTVVGD